MPPKRYKSPQASRHQSEDGRGRKKGKGKGRGSGFRSGADEIREATPGVARGRGRKARGAISRENYQRRYDYLLAPEPATQFGLAQEVSVSELTTPDFAMRNRGETSSGRGRGTSREELNSGMRINQKRKSSSTRSYNTAVFSYEGEILVHSSDMDASSEVVLPANENRAEVVLDRHGSHKHLMASSSVTDCITTWGLGYVEEKVGGKDMGNISEEKSTSEHVFGLVPKLVEQVGATCKEECVSFQKARKGKKSTSVDEEASHSKLIKKKTGVSAAFLSIGGMKVYTTDVSDMSDDEGPCTAEEIFSNQDDGHLWSTKFNRGKKRNKTTKPRKNRIFNPYGTQLRSNVIDSSDRDESLESSDSDVSDALVDDYLTNCEGLRSDINDPNWVEKNRKSLQQIPIEDMILREEDVCSSEEEDSDEESDDCSDSGGTIEDDLEHRCRITPSTSDQQIIPKTNDEKTPIHGDSDVDGEDLAERVFFGYDSDSSCSDDDKLDSTFGSDDQAHIHDLEIDEETCIRYLEIEDRGGDRAGGKPSQKYGRSGGSLVGTPEDVNCRTSVATQTWPFSTDKRVKKAKGIPGQKKSERKETIATKRRLRALARGFDLNAVNKALEEMVMKKEDIIAFEPMESRDRAQVHRLAGIYKLKSSSQGTTKRRFVVVSITRHTGMPSGEDKLRLLRLLGQQMRTPVDRTPRSGKTLTGEEQRKVSKMKRAARQALQGMETTIDRRGPMKSNPLNENLTKSSQRKVHSKDKSRRRLKTIPNNQAIHSKKNDRKAVVYANNPVSFIARGHEGDQVGSPSASMSKRSTRATPSMEDIVHPRLASLEVHTSAVTIGQTKYAAKANNPDFGVFEAHTKGFGSRIMAKMGFVEGHGLGREKQGIFEPVEAVKRPKSLGLGAHV